MVKYKDQVSEATEELSESVREANKVIAESAVAAVSESGSLLRASLKMR